MISIFIPSPAVLSCSNFSIFCNGLLNAELHSISETEGHKH